MEWEESVETLLQKYCDESQVREALHRKAYYWYKRALTCFQLPIIILSALSGSMQFLSKSYPHLEGTIIIVTAGTSIGVSIISAVMTYLKLGEYKNKHEVSQVAWQNFYNTVKHTLSLSRDLRQDSSEFLQTVKASYDRLFEISPICNQGFIKAIKKKVRNATSPEFAIPCYLNGFRHTPVYGRGDEYEENTPSLH